MQAAGNEAFKEGRHVDAIEHYSAALACSTESRPFAAICFCNRAAAYQAMGQIADAIADCSLAIALDPSYLKVGQGFADILIVISISLAISILSFLWL